ncbi:hypothetical protein EV421DRAFT_1902534 [Armillaria borealis]|uniref:Uncharacterized protein n=1 Tax=Armillaria borealis TaxID=47425 RepID=A0AA39JNQ8_9AGAR|nr:hypothetical protein EV421DRAFT_1902534 [Armillaria borealis]
MTTLRLAVKVLHAQKISKEKKASSQDLSEKIELACKQKMAKTIIQQAVPAKKRQSLVWLAFMRHVLAPIMEEREMKIIKAGPSDAYPTPDYAQRLTQASPANPTVIFHAGFAANANTATMIIIARTTSLASAQTHGRHTLALYYATAAHAPSSSLGVVLEAASPWHRRFSSHFQVDPVHNAAQYSPPKSPLSATPQMASWEEHRLFLHVPPPADYEDEHMGVN